MVLILIFKAFVVTFMRFFVSLFFFLFFYLPRLPLSLLYVPQTDASTYENILNNPLVCLRIRSHCTYERWRSWTHHLESEKKEGKDDENSKNKKDVKMRKAGQKNAGL